LRRALEELDVMISELEDRLGHKAVASRENQKKTVEQLKTARAREAGAMALNQKIAQRLDQTIDQVERILRN
jgi:hypothetical protein